MSLFSFFCFLFFSFFASLFFSFLFFSREKEEANDTERVPVAAITVAWHVNNENDSVENVHFANQLIERFDANGVHLVITQETLDGEFKTR